jgi:hypothetical protein
MFNEGQAPTIQASCLERAMRLGDRTVNLVIWDTAGQERFHALGPIYYRDADAALLVFDITDTDSFKRVHMWVRELRKMVRAACPCSKHAARGRSICAAPAGSAGILPPPGHASRFLTRSATHSTAAGRQRNPLDDCWQQARSRAPASGEQAGGAGVRGVRRRDVP